LKGISIDHKIPMKKILLDNAKSFPQLSNITYQLKKLATHNRTAKFYKTAGTMLLKQSSANHIDIELLKVELDLIKTCTKLQLMDKIENLKKSAN
jgi:hypothetical protein